MTARFWASRAADQTVTYETLEDRPEGEDVIELERVPDQRKFERVNWSTGAIIDDLPAYRRSLISLVDRERETRIAALIGSPGIQYAKQRKGQQAITYVTMTAAARGALTSAQSLARFAGLVADADRQGGTLLDAANRIITGMSDSDQLVMRIDAAAVAGKAAIAALPTTASRTQIERAFAGVIWPAEAPL